MAAIAPASAGPFRVRDYSHTMTHLFDSVTLRDTELPNRLTVSPMCQYSVEERDGLATPWHHVHLGSRAVGGAGLVIAEATAVEPRGRITPYVFSPRSVSVVSRRGRETNNVDRCNRRVSAP
ncbi:2,4-dienoyl-CoA reductase-like NADH-dependent reductase (Old Yellow Enzyme family), partial [Halarchaeum solikamskense]|nr:2,4-dienoyl-CoA reductase-like NADH-dependent reductase (Old Yellow Enzyme family) [Halarchaeum solikamskense]